MAKFSGAFYNELLNCNVKFMTDSQSVYYGIYDKG